ncbi:MAG: toxic anion resistance protein [Chloroflexota bacterium]
MDLSPAEQRRVSDLAAKIDLADGHSILSFGVDAQREVTATADRMLEGVRNKDTGPVGETLSELMLRVRGLGLGDLKPDEQPNWFSRVILRQMHPVARFVQRYQSVQQQVDSLASALERHEVRLLRDVTMLDKLYDASLVYFRELALYIAAAEAKLRELDEVLLPPLRERAEQTGNLLDVQNLRDLSARRADLERRLHDLRLTRQVTLQSLPQIRLIQDVDKSLINKVQSSILTTIPVWKSQIAMAITLWNQRQALRTQRMVTDTTNEMLRRNAELLRTGNAEARREIERGLFDIETLRRVNDELIATIRESIEIATEGQLKRSAAETEIKQLEVDLKQALLDATEQQRQLPGPAGEDERR